MSYPYGIIGNCISAALVSDDASIDWLCMPHYDSPSICAKLLDAEKGGSFKITGVNTTQITQEYVRHTAILKTRVETAEGVFDIYDFMPRYIMSDHEYYCPSEVQRNILVISGKPRIKVHIDLRPNNATTGAKIIEENEYLKYVNESGDYHSFYLYTNIDFKKITGHEEITLSGTSYLVLSYHQKVLPFNADRNYLEFERTKSYWLGWVANPNMPEAHREWIIRSLITLKLLMYQRTGAVIAAPTTSLPEIVGQERNWDYRYCWIRDASMIIELFSRLGHFHSSSRYMGFILNQMLSKQDNIAVMYSIHGEKVLEEKALAHLSGYRNSRPVRVGNNAYKQIQNDLYGELIDAIFTYFTINHRKGFHFDQELWTVVRTLVNRSAKVWEKPDNGIWEYRGQPQHFVFSKLMNWVAMDRAAKIARFIGKTKYAQECFERAYAIREDILTKGWNAEKEAFTMYYGSSAADAAVLLMLHYGFLEPDDPRMIKTIEFCHRELLKDGHVMRYTHDDDFGKPQNAFVLCTFWMAKALYLVGRKEEARTLFRSALAAANPLGLFSEGYNPREKCQVGNFPQGYSHMAFIQTALLLETDSRWGTYQWDGPY